MKIIIKNKNHIISFLLKSIPCTCFIYLLAITSVNASPEKVKNNAKSASPQKVQLSFIPEKRKKTQRKNNRYSTAKDKKALNLSINTKIPSHINFSKMKKKNNIKQMKERYLTIYSRKKGKEKLKAAYLHGAYAIKYVQKW